MTTSVLALGLAYASSWAAETAQTLTLNQLQQKQGATIDTHQNTFYNGWPQSPDGPLEHELSVLNLSAAWFDKMNDGQPSAWIKSHQLKTGAPAALYGSDSDIRAVKSRLRKAGFNQISILSGTLTDPAHL